jgi:2-polyprenyl-3-methyl-5-hydroxy-6-metoxy-1,4-benzoquinol methylase
MMLLFKKGVKHLFARLGLDIRLIRRHKQIISPEILDAVRYNQQASMDAFYSNPERVRKYIQQDMAHFYDHVLELLDTEIEHWEGKRILDMGCGTGELLRLIHQQHPSCQLFGLEFSRAALTLAQANLPDGHFSWFDIYEPINGQYDLVICTEVLEHLLDPENALQRVLSAIAPEGMAFLSVPDGRQDAFAGHIHYWSPESWLLFLQKHAVDWTIQTGTFHAGTKNYAVIRSLS